MFNSTSKKYINILLVSLSSSIPAAHWINSPLTEEFISLNLYRPFVYRQLSICLARFLVWLGLYPDLAIVLIVAVSGVGFYLSIRKLVFLIYGQSEKSEIAILLMVLFGVFIFSDRNMPYDLMTAWLFTLGFTYLMKQEYGNYALLFPLICLNRETGFLLAILCFVILLNKFSFEMVWLFLHQVVIWLGVKIILNTMFSGNGGLEVWITPLQNITKFIDNPFTTILHLFITAVLLFVVTRDWNEKVYFFKLAFVVFAPLQIVLYLIAGQAFEVRVFWEIYPVIVIISVPTLLKFYEYAKENIIRKRKIFSYDRKRSN